MDFTKWLLPVELALLGIAAWLFGDTGILVVIAVTLFGLANFVFGTLVAFMGRYPNLFRDE